LLSTDPEAALKDCNLALELDPDLAWAYNTRAIIRRSRGISSEGEADLRRFWRLQPQREPLGTFGTQDFGFSARNASELLGLTVASCNRRSIEPDLESANIVFDAAIAWYRAGDSVSALEAFEQLRTLQPDSIHVRYDRMLVLRQLGRPDSPAELVALLEDPRFQEFVEEDRDAFLAYQLAASDAFESTNVESAIDLASAGLAHAQKRKRFEQESHYLLSRIYAFGARTNPGYAPFALKHLSEALRDNPTAIKQWVARDELFDDLRPEIERMFHNARTQPNASETLRDTDL
jgi:tetratricopeptide (TPR) repeat protein